MTMTGIAVATAVPEAPGAVVPPVAAGHAVASNPLLCLWYPSPLYGGYLTVLDTYLRIQWREGGPILGQAG